MIEEVGFMRAQGINPLPPSLPPIGLSRVEAAAYIGVSPSMFDLMVKDGRMPGPKRINGRVVWDRKRVEAYWAALPDEDSNQNNPFDRIDI
jgi:predicted DNA-binding transcriptional regulator AlpA